VQNSFERLIFMIEPLATYLHDHMAGAGFAIDLLQAMKERQIKKPSGEFVGTLLAKIQEDEETLKQLADKIGSGSNTVKEFTAWVVKRSAASSSGLTRLAISVSWRHWNFLPWGLLANSVFGRLCVSLPHPTNA
jgi:hypothetical protein